MLFRFFWIRITGFVLIDFSELPTSLPYVISKTVASYILLGFSFAENPEAERNFEVELFGFDRLPINFTLKNSFQFYVA